MATSATPAIVAALGDIESRVEGVKAMYATKTKGLMQAVNKLQVSVANSTTAAEAARLLDARLVGHACESAAVPGAWLTPERANCGHLDVI